MGQAVLNLAAGHTVTGSITMQGTGNADKEYCYSALMGVIIIFFAFAVSWVAENVHTDSFGIQGSYSSLVVQDDSALSRADRERIEESDAISKLKDFLDRENIDIVAVPTGDSFPQAVVYSPSHSIRWAKQVMSAGSSDVMAVAESRACCSTMPLKAFLYAFGAGCAGYG